MDRIAETAEFGLSRGQQLANPNEMPEGLHLHLLFKFLSKRGIRALLEELALRPQSRRDVGDIHFLRHNALDIEKIGLIKIHMEDGKAIAYSYTGEAFDLVRKWFAELDSMAGEHTHVDEL